MTAPEMFIVGRLRKAHGIRGDLMVEPITDAPAEIFAAGRRLFVGTGSGELDPAAGTLLVSSARPVNGGAYLVHFDEITDRTQADLWRERYLLLPASDLQPPAPNEIWYHELIGMRVEKPGGEPVGEVTEFYELPQGIAIEVGLPSGSVVLPLAPEFVREIDRDERRIVVSPPDGLLE